MRIIDSHCHPQFPQYDSDREAVIQRALDQGIGMIAVGTDLETSRQAIALAHKYEGVWATVGLHPNDELNIQFDPEKYESLLSEKKVVAFGEIGLDYFRTTSESDQLFQKERFIQQLELAKKNDMKLVLHCRDGKRGSTGKAYPEMISILRNGYSALGGVVHSFTGTIDEANEFLNLGFHIGFNGIITFSETHHELVKTISMDRILLETDAPFLAPEPHRGQRNESLHVSLIGEKIAEIRQLDVDKVLEIATENSVSLFGLYS